MSHITRRTLGPLLFAGILTCFGYIGAQQSPSQRSGRTQSVKPQSTQATPQQQNDELRDQLKQLQMQVKDLQAAIDDLKSEQQMIEATTKETRELVLDSRVTQTQGREDLNSLARTVSRNEKQINELGQQVSSMMLDLRRVKTKVGLY
jgi:predicted RNase H-like nuclease (RuvC/YqgF family)